MGDLPGYGGGAAAVLKPLASSTGPRRPQNWAAAERACREIIRKVQPTSVSEEKRKAVIQYIQRLIRTCLGAEVFPYGSVPLKTYLPDGDIDLTVFGGTNYEDTLADDMKAVLEEEERNAAAEFVVKDVQLIRAEVQIVKCIVQDIVVDISFNQIGGVCTLCFLEQIDRAIGKDHLFKHSIILIKAWCYYESRILGAHHGLISTYALETLVLYIFHFYHSSLDGPLAVLYKFLDYFSKFRWDSYCISLDGPIQVTPLPPVIDIPEDSDQNLLLNREFLNYCVGMFAVPFRDSDSSRLFALKHLNIVDPLKEGNNLGRSVNKGNFYRIRSAFSYGAKKLAKILAQPQHSIGNELRKFFTNTLERHGGGPRPDVHDIYHRAVGESGDLTTSRLDALKISADSSKSHTPRPVFAPHLFFSKSKRHDRSITNGSLDSDKLDNSEKNASENQLADRDEAAASSKTREILRDTHETLNSTDLSGDFDTYLQYLHYGKLCYEYSLFSMHSLPMPPFVNPSRHSSGMWDNFLPQLRYKQNGFSHQYQNGFSHQYQNGFSYQHQNGFHQNPALYFTPRVLIPGVPYWEEVPKPRGTGTYFPTMNVPFQGYRPQSMKGRNQVHIRSPRNNGRNVIFKEPNDSATVSPSDSYVPFSPQQNGYQSTNGLFVPPPEGVAELEETSGPVSSSPRTLSGTQKSPKVKNRILLTSAYHLKNEEDFPPLST